MCIFPERAAFFYTDQFFLYLCCGQFTLPEAGTRGMRKKTIFCSLLKENFQPFLGKKLSTFLYLKIYQAFFFGNDSMVIADSCCEPGSPYGGKESRLGMVDQS